VTPAAPELLLVRHGETEWSRAGRHTGRSDLPLTDEGRRQAEQLRGRLAGRTFERVLSSPLSRARETCRLAGCGEQAELRDELLEWDYGAYEGLTTLEIRARVPGWNLWRDGCPDGETAADVGARVDAVIGELRALEGDAIAFAHGHVLRVLAVRWIELEPPVGANLALGTASVSVLGRERETPAIWLWNGAAHLSAHAEHASGV
jgi:broad specificity phosphatase PhoE